jgi:hypothetical protein
MGVWVVSDVQYAQAEDGEERGLGAFVYLEGPQEGDLWFLLTSAGARGGANILE